MRTELKKLGLLEYTERIDAVNGKKLDIDTIPDNIITPQGKQDAMSKLKRVYVPLTMGAIGCALSHKIIYEKMIQENLDCALILEDDIVFGENFNSNLDNILQSCPGNCDMLFLGYHQSTLESTGVKINELLDKYGRVYGLFGYVVFRSGAEKLLNLFPLSHQIDTVISDNIDKFNAFMVNPKYRIIYSDSSSIHTRFGTDIQIREKIDIPDTVIWVLILFLVGVTVYLCVMRFSQTH